MPLKLIPTTPKKSLNAAFLKVRPLRSEIDAFKTNLIKLLDKVDESEREENQKNLIRDFLVNTYYGGKREVNTKGTIDLVIHTDSSNKSSVGVIIEAKRPSNKSEWISADKPNGKALHELILYYMRERVDAHNIDIKNIILTNIYEWYIIDAAVFDKLFYQNKKFVKAYESWRDGQKVTSDTGLFYTEIAKPYLDEINEEIPCTYFDIRSYEKELRNADKDDDNKLIELYKLLSEHHLLNVPFANDSNSLDKRFYTELLHIIGLTESKEGSKKLIGRHKEGERHSGTILEDAIIQIEAVDKLNRVSNVSQYGSTKDERLFNIALELSITWINRILFLKLLEGQLVAYHRRDKNYLFLNNKTIKEYDDLNTIFFQVLAKKHEERNSDVKTIFARVPYLNSSLFEPTELEHETILISNLRDEKTMPIHSQTVLKDANGQKRTGTISALAYLFDFLDAYDFASEGSVDIQEDNKTLINASVLGLIFEKINGYKDGSFFTPGFITMYMCRETIRRAVVQKFNESKGWTCNDITDLYNKIEDRTEANAIVNSIKICDPAVGSGHFLVSALNEMIAIKSDLHILQDKDGRLLRGYKVEVVNDELSIRDEDGDLYAYNPRNTESQRIQETLFHEKETIIESCLFGVDINPNSVKICRLRLWIELLKNAYYKAPDVLETLPNIDINIKCGNSLISRFALDVDMSEVFKKRETTVEKYLLAVQAYKDTNDKEAKAETKDFIDKLKAEFTTTLYARDPKKVEMSKLRGRISLIDNAAEIGDLFGKLDDVNIIKDRDKLQKQLDKLEAEIAEQQSGKFYDDVNAFEWRFEFPEVLSNEGAYLGFDVVIGNPPYIVYESDNISLNELEYFKNDKRFSYAQGGKLNAYKLFLTLAPSILKIKGINSQIFQISFLGDSQAKKIREFYLYGQNILRIDAFPERDNENKRVFEEAKMSVCILISENSISETNTFPMYISFEKNIGNIPIILDRDKIISIDQSSLSFPIAVEKEINLLIKIQKNKQKLSEIIKCYQGELNISTHKMYFQSLRNDFLLLKGAQIQKYFTTSTPSQGIVEYVKVEDYLKDFFNPKSQHHKKPRIVMQGITGVNEKIRIKATLSDENNFCAHSCNYIVLDSLSDQESFEILGLLNSRLYNWIFKITSTNSNVNSYEIENLPYIFSSRLKIGEIASQIIDVKNRDTSFNTSELESQIDQMVYELYGLTEDEIAIVEGKEINK